MQAIKDFANQNPTLTYCVAGAAAAVSLYSLRKVDPVRWVTSNMFLHPTPHHGLSKT